jgi:hypothetical protein
MARDVPELSALDPVLLVHWLTLKTSGPYRMSTIRPIVYISSGVAPCSTMDGHAFIAFGDGQRGPLTDCFLGLSLFALLFFMCSFSCC